MASRGLINRVKYSPWLYNVYYHIGSLAVKILGWFIKKDQTLIVFSSFGGRKYDDSPKCIYERMIHDHRFDDYNIVWAFIHPEAHDIPCGKKVKTDSLAYYKALLKARCWVTNSSMERGLSIRCNVFYYNSWHGTPIKLMGNDIHRSNLSFSTKGHGCLHNVFCAQSQFDAAIFKRSFGIPDQAMKIIGLPRNDELSKVYGKDYVNRIKEKLGIPKDKKVILYAPTFREYTKDENLNCIIAPPIHIEKWKEKIGQKYVLLFRAHYEIVKVMNVESDDFMKDVSAYPNLNELMIASDMLISDYSSIFFDYSIMGKPMLCFAYDYNEYESKRGMYFDIRQEIGCMDLNTEDKVLSEITSMDRKMRVAIAQKFRDKYVTSYGKATELSLDLIYEGIKNEK